MIRHRVSILGVPVDCVDWQLAMKQAAELIACGSEAKAIIAVNPEKVIQAGKNPRLLAQLRRAGLLIPDGIGVVMAARLMGLGRMERVPGSEMMPALCALAAEKGYAVFLFGAAEDVNAKAAAALQARYPMLRIAGRQNGYVKAEDLPDLIARINASGAQLLFIALGSPKQEIWMEENLPKLSSVRVCQGVGGTFDVLAGNVRRAPALFRALNLEWFYRLVTNPRRIRRQASLPLFAWRVLKARFGL